MWYWVIQAVGGVTMSHGPWKSKEARDKAYGRISGGEIYKFNSKYGKGEEEEAKQEFLKEQLNKD